SWPRPTHDVCQLGRARDQSRAPPMNNYPITQLPNYPITQLPNYNYLFMDNITSLQVSDANVGTGVAAATGKEVTVHYTGWLYELSVLLRHGLRSPRLYQPDRLSAMSCCHDVRLLDMARVSARRRRQPAVHRAWPRPRHHLLRPGRHVLRGRERARARARP